MGMYEYNRDSTKEALQDVAYCDNDDMFKVKSVQKKWRDSFTTSELDATKWDSSVGTGATIAQSGGVLSMTSGTTESAETYILSKETFTIPFRLSIGMTLSQRIINQECIVEFVSVNPATLVPDGLHRAGLVFSGTNALRTVYRVQNGGLPVLDSAESTISSTASGGIYEIELFADEAWFHGGTLDANVARSQSYRRHQQIPDPNALYKIKISWLNGSTAPASSTTAAFQFLACQDYAELTAEITAGRGASATGQALSVNVGAMPSSPIAVVLSQGATNSGAGTFHNAISAASTNATSVKNGTAALGGGHLTNNTAAWKYFKLYNKSSAPTVGTDTPVATIGIPPNSSIAIGLPMAVGTKFSSGIAYAITGAIANADTTAIGANEVAVCLNYT